MSKNLDKAALGRLIGCIYQFLELVRSYLARGAKYPVGGAKYI